MLFFVWSCQEDDTEAPTTKLPEITTQQLSEKYQPIDVDEFKETNFYRKASELQQAGDNFSTTGDSDYENIVDSLDLSIAVQFEQEDTIYYTIPYYDYFDDYFVNLHIEESGEELEVIRVTYTEFLDSISAFGEIIDLEFNPINGISSGDGNGDDENEQWDCHIEFFEYWEDCCYVVEAYEVCDYVGGGAGNGPNDSGGSSPQGSGNSDEDPLPTTTPIQPENEDNCESGGPLDLNGNCAIEAYEECLGDEGQSNCWIHCVTYVNEAGITLCVDEDKRLHDIQVELPDLSPEEVSCFTGNQEQQMAILSYLDEDNADEELAYGFARLLCEVEDARFDRYQELDSVLQANPNALIEDCFDSDDEYPIEFWSDLASLVPNNDCLNRLDSLNGNWEVQYLADPSTPKVNLDYFAVNISELPIIKG